MTKPSEHLAREMFEQRWIRPWDDDISEYGAIKMICDALNARWNEAAAAERERCAAVCDVYGDALAGRICATAIREGREPS